MNGWAFATIVACGVLTGVGFELAAVRIPIWYKMDLPTFAVDFRRSCKFVDIYIPAFHTVTVIAAFGLAIDTSGSTRTLTIVALVLLVLTLVSSRVFNVPIRQEFIHLPEGEVPPGAEAMRRTWALAHQGRAALIFVAFILLTIAVL